MPRYYPTVEEMLMRLRREARPQEEKDAEIEQIMADIQEARALPRIPPYIRKKALRAAKDVATKGLKWEDRRDTAIREIEDGRKTIQAQRDSINAYLNRTANIPEQLIEEAVANYLRKARR